jgi:hypothetical protein
MIRQMKLSLQEEKLLVSQSPTEYVENAIRVATSGMTREILLNSLRTKSASLFNDRATIDDWEAFMEKVVLFSQTGD